jgi:hypothetical protein
MKKFILVLFATVMVCSLVACSGKSSDKTDSVSTLSNSVKVEDLNGTKDEVKDNKKVNETSTNVETVKDKWILAAAGRTGAYIEALESVKDEDASAANIIKYAANAKDAGYDAYSFIAIKYGADQTSYAFYAVNTNLSSKPDAIAIVSVKTDGTTNVTEFTGDKSEIFSSYTATETETETTEDTKTTEK